MVTAAKSLIRYHPWEVTTNIMSNSPHIPRSSTLDMWITLIYSRFNVVRNPGIICRLYYREIISNYYTQQTVKYNNHKDLKIFNKSTCVFIKTDRLDTSLPS